MNSKPQETPPSSSKISKPKLRYPRLFEWASKGAQLKHIAPSPAPPSVIHPWIKSSLFRNSRLASYLFSHSNWIQPLLSLGYRRPLVETDLWALDHDRQSDILSDKLLENTGNDSLQPQKDQPAGDPKHLAKASLVRSTQRHLLSKILDCWALQIPTPTATLQSSRLWACNRTVPYCKRPRHFFYISSLPEHVVQDPGNSFLPSQLVGHISSDVSRIDVCMGLFHMSWATPIQLAAILAILVLQIGPSSLAGVGFI
ncbi:hypothetical protein PGTUg99_000048 [Puccinia graminis f. sp. tritici]|uniref:Uncharacterized protein n=1 Tax=Puccinia graminis f. sp. tritici TaxID=56615 RepID=A0A5B0N858_PUCGR|nr:hypothetical protein PGTUg99_000048 [Puccinia graminis f. sp. tritici]